MIASGRLAEGDELPPVRQLANDLGINLNTVARAYRALTDAGLLASVRGRGTVVISSTGRSAGSTIEETRQIERLLAKALADAKIAGLRPAEVRTMLEHHMTRLWGTT